MGNPEKLEKTIDALNLELRFTPGSQPRLCIPVEDLRLILGGAKKAVLLEPIAHELYEAVDCALSELEMNGLHKEVPKIDRAMAKLEEHYPELNDQDTGYL